MGIKIRLLSLIIFTTVAWIIGFVWFMGKVPDRSYRLSEEVLTSTPAIIALTGGSQRVATAIDLLQQAPQAKLLISGVGKESKLSHILKLNNSPQEEMINDKNQERISLGTMATDTHGNAVESYVWMELGDLQKALVVTSNYHLPRAMFELKMLMPEREFIPYPVTGGNVDVNRWWSNLKTALLLLSEYHKYLFIRFMAF